MGRISGILPPQSFDEKPEKARRGFALSCPRWFGNLSPMPNRRTLLVDNGSLNPRATLRLRELAAEMTALLGRTVDPVSVLHSDKVDPAELGGVRALTFEPYAREALAQGVATLEIFPLFIGPSLAITEFLPQLAAKVGVTLETRPTLAGPGRADALAGILADNLLASGWKPGAGNVLLCDHGSPIPEVTAVREDLAARLRARLGLADSQLVGCAMERREGPAYAFNEPMLSDVVARQEADFTVLMLFLLPGRHAGAGGDVDTLCREHARPGVGWRLSPLLGEHPALMRLAAGV